MKNNLSLTIVFLLLLVTIAGAEQADFVKATIDGSTGKSAIDFEITTKTNAYYSKKRKDTRISFRDSKKNLSIVVLFPGKASGVYELTGKKEGAQVKFAIVRDNMMTSGVVTGTLTISEVGPQGIKGSFEGTVPVRDAMAAMKEPHKVKGEFQLPTSGMK